MHSNNTDSTQLKSIGIEGKDNISLRLLSIIIPARDEEGSIVATVKNLYYHMCQHDIPHEIIVVDDGSCDGTWSLLQILPEEVPTLHAVRNQGAHGFGLAIRTGFDHMQGDAVVIMMADGSDDAMDVVHYWNKLNEGYECVFGSRFVHGSRLLNYPWFKLLLNRLANLFIRVIFSIRLNDTTNAFKAYRRTVIEGCRPFLSPHFNLTVEIPLKAIVRGYSWTVIPISWYNRKTGISKLRIKEMGSPSMPTFPETTSYEKLV